MTLLFELSKCLNWNSLLYFIIQTIYLQSFCLQQFCLKNTQDFQLHTEKLTSTDIAKRLHTSVSAIQRNLEQFSFTENLSRLPEILSWDEFSCNKGKLAFIAPDFKTKQIVTILENNRQTTIKNYFYKYTREVREQVKFVT